MSTSAFDTLDPTIKERYIALARAGENNTLRQRITNNQNIPTNEKDNVFDDTLVAAQAQQRGDVGQNEQMAQLSREVASMRNVIDRMADWEQVRSFIKPDEGWAASISMAGTGICAAAGTLCGSQVFPIGTEFKAVLGVACGLGAIWCNKWYQNKAKEAIKSADEANGAVVRMRDERRRRST